MKCREGRRCGFAAAFPPHTFPLSPHRPRLVLGVRPRSPFHPTIIGPALGVAAALPGLSPSA
ncbi:MAG: hypothetical protein V9G20_07790 [Candidatus Promineifilaceae bacterium]